MTTMKGTRKEYFTKTDTLQFKSLFCETSRTNLVGKMGCGIFCIPGLINKLAKMSGTVGGNVLKIMA